MSGKNQCSYCYRSFARSEHLSRHERSHRNERPYKCPSCSGSFTRKDVFKRHHTRHHGQPVQASPQQHAPGPSNVDPPISLPAGWTPTSSYGAVSVTTRDGMEPSSATGFDQADLLLMNSSIVDSLVSVLDCPAIPRSDLFSALTGQAHQRVLAGPVSSCGAFRGESGPAPARAPQVMESPGWKGSFAISEQKRCQLAAEVVPTEELNGLVFPSRLTWERLLNTFAECFLIYIPCIHTPTWKADLAPPCMIFAMASIGASYHDDNTTATWLHRLATACLKKYLASSPLTIADEPIWVLQCLLLIIVNGTKSASFRTFQEAVSLTSLLIEGIRYRKLSPFLPELEEGEDIDLLEQWRKWIDFETTVRTTYAIYVYLGALGVTFQTASIPWNMDPSDCFLPCEETEWMSISPQTWLDTRPSNFNPPVRFSAAMASLFSGQWAPPLRLSSFGSYVTLHGIVKQLAILCQDSSWLLADTPAVVQRFEQALARWRMCSEQNPEFHYSPRYPSGVIAVNALSLYRQAHVRLCGNFGPLRSAFATRNVQTILSSIDDITIVISSSSTCRRAARCALDALQTSVRMGMSLTGSISGWHHKLLFNLYSLECCLFHSFWIREQSNRSRADRSAEENDLVKSTEETLAEIDLDPVLASKPCWIKLIYAWSLVFQNCNATELYGIVAEVLKIYADGLTG